METLIFERPDPTSTKLGYLRAGAVMKTSAAPAGTVGCPKGWYPIEPAGYVCRGPTASLDRKDSSLGYTLDNIQWVHRTVNKIKLDLQQDEFVEWCKRVAAHANQAEEVGEQDSSPGPLIVS